MKPLTHTAPLALAITAIAAAGGEGAGGGSAGTDLLSTPSAQVAVLLSDASNEDWALIGVKLLSIALTPQDGSAPVTVYTAPAGGTAINIAQLDQLNEILGNASVPVGSYSGATLTIAANPGDVQLTVSADPEAGFAEAAGTSIPSSRIQIQHAQGSTGDRRVPVNVSFAQPLVVSATQSNALSLELDLSKPSFLTGHVPAGSGTTIWAVNFNGSWRHHRVDDLAHLVLRHAYGQVNTVAADGTSLTIDKTLPVVPATSPETAAATGKQLTVLADAANGTLVYDLDGKASTTVRSFSGVASLLAGKQVRVAARYQNDGTLVATRVYASSSFAAVWLSPEGHVLHVDNTHHQLTLTDESGSAKTVTVDAGTRFFFRTPASALADATPIGTGTAFLANLVRGFKVHVQLVDPLATTWVAQSVDIETAAFEGKISAATTSGFTYTRNFAGTADDYTLALPYLSASSANGKDADGNAITGFKTWNFAYPTLVDSGSTAIPDFIATASGSVNFGGTVGALTARGASFARWGDAAAPTGWSAPWVVLQPTRLPKGTVASTLTAGNTFGMSVAGGSTPATVTVGTTSGSATLVYQVDRTNGVVTVSPVDVSTAAGLATLQNGLALGATVRVYGVPQASGTLKAYELAYYTGDASR